jgi:hypothetical protein
MKKYFTHPTVAYDVVTSVAVVMVASRKTISGIKRSEELGSV